MNTGQQILFSVSALGAFNGLVLSLYLFISKRKQSPAVFFLALLLLVISIRVGKSVLLYFDDSLPIIYRQIGLSACFLIGPSLYYFFKSALTPVIHIPTAWKWSWGVQLALLAGVGIIFPYARHMELWHEVIIQVIYLQWALYVIAAGYELRHIIAGAFRPGHILSATEKCWLLIYGGSFIIYLLYVASLYGVVRGTYIGGAISFSAILYVNIFFFLYGANVNNLLLPGGTLPVSAKKKIPEQDAASWISKLETALREPDVYKNPNLKLSDLAAKINISAHQLSQLLNDNLGKSFSTYINEYRINEACRLILTNNLLTFEAIGYEVGYNSKSTFYTAFKKITDTTPALYKERAAQSNIS